MHQLTFCLTLVKHIYVQYTNLTNNEGFKGSLKSLHQIFYFLKKNIKANIFSIGIIPQ